MKIRHYITVRGDKFPIDSPRDCKGVTEASVRINDTDYSSYAFCGPNDQFSKKMGSHIAKGRLTKLLCQLNLIDCVPAEELNQQVLYKHVAR